MDYATASDEEEDSRLSPDFTWISEYEDNRDMDERNDENRQNFNMEPKMSFDNGASDHLPKQLLQQLPSRNIESYIDAYTLHTLKSQRGSLTPPGTVRLRNIPPAVFSQLKEDQAIDLIRRDPDLDITASDKTYGETLRGLHYSLSLKKRIKDELESKVKKENTLGCCELMKYKCGMSWIHLKNNIKTKLNSLKPWHKNIKEVEGSFGSGVASYFYFLRWLLGLNVTIFIVMFSFISFPQILNDAFGNKTHNLTTSMDSNVHGLDVLTGGGWFEKQILFYGSYTSDIISLSTGFLYDFPLAYFLTSGITLLICLVLLAYSFAKSYQQHYIESSGYSGHLLVSKVFCGWDFAITKEAAATLHSKSLILDIQEYLAAVNKKKQSSEKFTQQLLIKLSFHIFTLAFLCGTGYLIYILRKEQAGKTGFLNLLLLPIVMTTVTLLLPGMFSLLALLETYRTQKSQLGITMFRYLLLLGTMTGVLILTPFKKEAEIYNSSENTTSLVINSYSECWETELGKEFYRLVIMDFIFCLLIYFPFEVIKKLLSKYKTFQSPTVYEFDVSWNTWNLLYNQVLCWLGLYFCPLLPLVLIIKFFLIFYIKRFVVMKLNKPPTRPWKAYQVQTIFLVVSLLGLVFSILLSGFVIISSPPSKTCGPFMGLSDIYDVFLKLTSSSDSLVWKSIAEYIMKPGCIILIIILLLCVAYYVRAIANARYNMVKLLRDQVKMEGRDKVFLLKLFEKTLRRWNKHLGLDRRKHSNFSSIEGDSREQYSGLQPHPKQYQNANRGDVSYQNAESWDNETSDLKNRSSESEYYDRRHSEGMSHHSTPMWSQNLMPNSPPSHMHSGNFNGAFINDPDYQAPSTSSTNWRHHDLPVTNRRASRY